MRHGVRARPLEQSLGVGIIKTHLLDNPVRQFA